MKTYQITLTEKEDGKFSVTAPTIEVNRQSAPIEMAAYLLSTAAEGMAEEADEDTEQFANGAYRAIVLTCFATPSEKEINHD